MIAVRSPKMRRRTRALAALCLALGGVVATEIATGSKLPPRAPGPVHARPVADLQGDTGFSLPSAGAYAEIVTRPLFSDTRRPPAVAAAAVAVAAPKFAFVGTIVSNQAREALIRHGKPTRVDRVAEGRSIDGWTVSSIVPDRVILTNGATRIEVKAMDGAMLATDRGRTAHETNGAATQSSTRGTRSE